MEESVMRRSISIIGGVLLAAALISPAWAKPGKGGGGGGGGESQAGGLPALEDRVDALAGQNNFAVVTETATTCTVVNSSSVPGPVTASSVSLGVCEVSFGKDVSACAYEATIGGTGLAAVPPGFITVSGDTDADSPDDVFVRTFDTTGAAAANNFSLTVTCP
jgi:hypothetical protein